MKIVVCVKQVPASSDAQIDPVTKRIVREGTRAVLNPFDTYALEEGVRLARQLGGQVIALSMGPPKAEACLREAISLGVDQAILLSDRAFGGSDTYATSYALARAIDTIGGVGLVICGKQAVDGDTAQVGPGIAAHLGWAQATYVMKVERADKDGLRLRRMNEEGWDVVEVGFPCVLTVLKDINQPRVPTLRGVLSAMEEQIPVWTPADIGADTGKLGLDGSPTRVVRTAPPPPRQTASKRLAGSPAQVARELVADLRTRGIL